MQNTLTKNMTAREEQQPRLLQPVTVKEFRMNKLNFDEMIFGGDTSVNMKLENTLSKRSGSLKISPMRSTVKKLLSLQASQATSPVKHWDDQKKAHGGISALPEISQKSLRANWKVLYFQ